MENVQRLGTFNSFLVHIESRAIFFDLFRIWWQVNHMKRICCGSVRLYRGSTQPWEREPHRWQETHNLKEVSQFLFKSTFTFTGYRKNRFFTMQILIPLDQGKCSLNRTEWSLGWSLINNYRLVKCFFSLPRNLLQSLFQAARYFTASIAMQATHIMYLKNHGNPITGFCAYKNSTSLLLR